jgi:hypothetical protein
MVDYIVKQMQEFDILHATEVEEKKWGRHPFYHKFNSIHALQRLAPTFPWAHNRHKLVQWCFMQYEEVIYVWPYAIVYKAF